MASRHPSASLRGLPVSKVPLRPCSLRAAWKRLRHSRYSLLSSSQPFNRGQVRSNASWATSIVPFSLPEMSRRACTNRSSTSLASEGMSAHRAGIRAY